MLLMASSFGVDKGYQYMRTVPHFNMCTKAVCSVLFIDASICINKMIF